MENLGMALKLMVVGMGTVFLILFIVIGLGKSLIFLVNRYAPGQSEAPATKAVSSTLPSRRDIPNGIVAAIVAAVGITTEGKGRIKSIKKKSDN